MMTSGCCSRFFFWGGGGGMRSNNVTKILQNVLLPSLVSPLPSPIQPNPTKGFLGKTNILKRTFENNVLLKRRKAMENKLMTVRSIGNRDSNFRGIRNRVTVCFKIYCAR